jgi:hypothetical protein
VVKGAAETTETAASSIISSHAEITIPGNKKASVKRRPFSIAFEFYFTPELGTLLRPS